ncbi:MAG: biotin-dependent carboxyltransferase family protein [Arenicellales bacterium]
MSQLKFLRAPFVSLQDAGRKGYFRYGIPPAGPMDWARHAMVNSMLNKPLSSAAIEIGPAGMSLSLDVGTLQVSFAGLKFKFLIDGERLPVPSRALLKAGQTLEVIPLKGAMWSYLGLQAEIDIPEILGSQSENSASGMRPVEITENTILPLKMKAPIKPYFQAVIDPYITQQSQSIRILPSTQYEDFSAKTQQSLVQVPWSIEPQFNRMAYRLNGTEIVCEQGHDILSDGITMGAIQVPGDGKPIILMADHQTTGGYPKIACISKLDLPRLTQIAPKQFFMFQWQTVEQARIEYMSMLKQIQNLTALSVNLS